MQCTSLIKPEEEPQQSDTLARTQAQSAAAGKRAERPFMYDMVHDLRAVVDWLAARDDVDPARIGMTGGAGFRAVAGFMALLFLLGMVAVVLVTAVADLSR